MHGKPSTIRSSATGDAAVEGLLHGLIAGAIMGGYVTVAGLIIRAASGRLLSTLAAMLGVGPMRVVLGHFAMAAFYGVIWGVLARYLFGRLSFPSWAWGLVYGGVLWAISTVPLPAGEGLPFVVSGGAHLVFGASLGLLSGHSQTPV